MNHCHPEVAEILLKFALLYSEEENFHGAKTTLEEALDMFVSACGEVSPKTASAYFQAAAILQKANEFRALAVDKAKKAIDIFVSLGMRSDHPDVMACRCLLGMLHRSLGQSEEAEEQFVKVQQQGSLHDEPCINAKIIVPEDANMFFQVQTDGGKGGCSHLGAEFLSLVNLVNMNMGDDQRSHLNALLGCLEEHDREVLTVLDYVGHNVYCVSHRVWIAGRAVYCILTSDPMLDPFQNDQGINFDDVHASSKSGNNKKPNVFLLSSNDHGKKPPFLLFWKTPRVLEIKDLSCVGPAFRESVNTLFVQPKFRKSYIGGQDFYMELTLPEDPCAMPSLCTQIDYLPLLAELELSESPKECGNIDSHVTAVQSSPHISYFSYKFPNQHQAEFVFHHVIFSLGKTLTEVQDVESANASAVQNFEFVHFLKPHNSISVVVEKESVVVKCHTLKELESNCICSSVRNTLENTMESLCHVVKMNFEPFLQLPCEDVGGNYMKQSSKCSCGCKHLQSESSCSGLTSETAHLCAHVEGNRTADMLQNENEEDVPFAGHPADKSSIEVCVSLLECLLSNRHVSSEVSSSGIGEISSTDSVWSDDNTPLNDSFYHLAPLRIHH
ncbi:hypothetical protein OS493_006154 [Desmophyllum pertusum]|uniref:Uncharacterized protein n=1 Tax=Desmophyllum pertusum TaxID=174260 RepID=A0A9X0A504_9CNID|nr:hypothetical protein OS493_006154 [Desmophyllum pertusum]